jgi:hypothetical protein
MGADSFVSPLGTRKRRDPPTTISQRGHMREKKRPTHPTNTNGGCGDKPTTMNHGWQPMMTNCALIMKRLNQQQCLYIIEREEDNSQSKQRKVRTLAEANNNKPSHQLLLPIAR